MPYAHLDDLPPSVRRALPQHAQEIYLGAFNSAWESYRDPDQRRGATREETAHRVAWAAVKSSYEKSPGGRWRRRPSR